MTASRTALLRLLVAAALLAGACSSSGQAVASDAANAEPTPQNADTTAADTAAGDTTTGDTGTPTSVSSTVASPTISDGRVVCEDLTLGASEFTMEAGGASHEVRVFVPSSAQGQPLPVVLNWHGLGSDGRGQAAFTAFEVTAEAEGFMVVHPTGVPVPGDTRNAWELSDSQDPGRDDVAFANELVDLLIEQWCGDEQRVYSTGLSNGGYFTARLVCEMSGRLAAATSVAGTIHDAGCRQDRVVPYRAYHGTDDRVVPFDGSGESVLLDPDNPNQELVSLFSQVIPDEFSEFATAAGCDSEPVRTDVSPEVVRYDYQGCDGGVPMAFFELVGSGHTWPGSPAANLVRNTLGFTTDDVSATSDSWEFFEQFTLG